MDFDKERKFILGYKLFNICAKGGALTNFQINERLNYLKQQGINLTETELIEKCKLKTGRNLEEILERIQTNNKLIDKEILSDLKTNFDLFTIDYKYAKLPLKFTTSFYSIFKDLPYFPLAIKKLFYSNIDTDSDSSSESESDTELESDSEEEDNNTMTYFDLYNNYIKVITETWDNLNKIKEEQYLNDESIQSLDEFLGHHLLDLANLRFNMPNIASHFTQVTGITITETDKPLPILDFEMIMYHLDRYMYNSASQEVDKLFYDNLEGNKENKISGELVLQSFINTFSLFYDSESINQYSVEILSYIKQEFENDANYYLNL